MVRRSRSGTWFLCKSRGIAKLSGRRKFILPFACETPTGCEPSGAADLADLADLFAGVLISFVSKWRSKIPDLLISEALPYGSHHLSCARLELHGTASVLRSNLPHVQARSCNNSCMLIHDSCVTYWYMLVISSHCVLVTYDSSSF